MHELSDVRCPDAKAERACDINRILDDMQRFGRFDAPPLQPPLEADVRVRDNKLCIDMKGACGERADISLTLAPLRRLIKDYRIICDNYSEAVALADPAKVETIDMGRKSYHDEGGEWLMDKLNGKLNGNLEACRYLFSLVNELYL